MKQTKRIAAALLAGLLLAGTMSACGGDSGSSAGAENSTAQTSSESSAAVTPRGYNGYSKRMDLGALRKPEGSD